MSGRHPTYFIGLSLPPEFSESIFSYKWRLFDETDHALKPLVPHITLLHPPSLSDTPPENILPQVRKLSAPLLPLTVSLGSIEAFDSTVLYIRARSTELETLQSQLVKLLPQESQAVYHQRGFTPHITLVQVRRPHTLDIEALRLRTNLELTLPSQFTAENISYFVRTQPREYRAEPI